MDTSIESLFLLHESSECILNSLHYLSKLSSSPKTKPAFLMLKSIDPLLKKMTKKFPITQEFYRKENCSEIDRINTDIVTDAQPYYDALLNLLSFRDTLVPLMSSLVATTKIEIASHSHVSILMLEVLTTYVRAIILMNSIEDIIKIIGSYGLAFQSINNTQEFTYINLAKFVASYTDPYKRLFEEFINCKKIFEEILLSLVDDLRMRCSEGNILEVSHEYNLSVAPTTMAVPNHCHFPELQLYGYLSFCKWFIYTCLVFPNFLSVQSLESVICIIISSNMVIPLHRETTIVPAKEILASIEREKSLSKKTKDIIDYAQLANSTFIIYHKQRRDYFTAALRETRQIVLNQPGILGPKFDKILQILSFVFESVYLWFLHYTSDVYKSKKTIGEIYDLSILTSIYEILEMRNVILKYETVVKRYYRSFISDYDNQALEHYKLLKDSEKLHFDDLDLSYYEGFQELCNLFKNTSFSETEEHSDTLLSMRLDWLRMQWRNVSGEDNCCSHLECCTVINNMAFHVRVLNNIAPLVDTCAPIHLLWNFSSVLNTLLHDAIVTPGFKRYSSVCIGVYSYFDHFKEKLCPEERNACAELCFISIDEQLDDISKECVKSFLIYLQQFREATKNESILSSVNSWLQRWSDSEKKPEVASKLKIITIEPPGKESSRILQGDLPEAIQSYTNLAENCDSLCLFRRISVLQHNFYPPQSVLVHLEKFIIAEIVNMANTYDGSMDKNLLQLPCRPSVMLYNVNALRRLVSQFGSLLNLNFDSLFYSCLLSMIIPKDLSPNASLVSIYRDCFLSIIDIDLLLGNVLYSPTRKCFISKNSSALRVDEFTDTFEMRALAQLLGPIGIKTINDSLDDYICNQMQLVRKFLATFSSSSFEINLYGSAQMDLFFKKDPVIDDIIGVLVKIGAASTFKTLLSEGLRYKVEDTCYHLHLALKSYYSKRFSGSEHIPKLYNYLGYDFLSDFPLMEKLSHSVFSVPANKDLWCKDFLGLLPLIVGYIAHKESCQYHSLVEAFTNNLHLVVTVFKTLVPKIYNHFNSSETISVEDAMKKICQMLSVLLCRMSNGTLTLNAIKNFENYFVIVNILSKDNPFLKQDTVEKYIPSCLVVSASDKLIRSKSSTRRIKSKAN